MAVPAVTSVRVCCVPIACAAFAVIPAEMKTTLKITLGGVITAVGLALMMITSLVPVGTYAFPCIAGILLVALVIEAGYAYAFSAFGATALLSFLLATDKEAALMYLIFFGYYPIIKSFIERIHNRVVQYIVKLAVFNVCMIAAFFIAVKLLSIPQDSFTLFGIYMPWAFLIAGNLVFILYDFCVTKLVTICFKTFFIIIFY